ncbi:hypothetical protein BDR05DRAFT_714000 [Suillus weaverae]|nr:hypothetical protein BDR05DRAFT_714000 [Suillus weaverae]
MTGTLLHELHPQALYSYFLACPTICVPFHCTILTGGCDRSIYQSRTHQRKNLKVSSERVPADTYVFIKLAETRC